MPGFNQQQLAYNALNANEVLILIGDQPVAFAQSVSHTFGLGTEAFYGVGSAKPQEIQQLKFAPSVTVDFIALTAAGNSLIQGGQTLASIIANNQFTIAIPDVKGNIRFTYVGCTASNFSEDIRANTAITDGLTFLAMDVLNQTGQSLLNGPNAYSVSGASISVQAGGLGVSVNANLNINI